MQKTEDALTVPESESGKIDKQNFEDIVQDVSTLFMEGFVNNSYQDGLQEDKDLEKEVCGGSAKELT